MKNILIMGFGMMGSSLAARLKSLDYSIDIDVFDTNIAAINFGLENSLIDAKYDKLSNKVYDLVVICSPLSSYENLFELLGAKIDSFKLIIDFGSLNSYPYKLLSNKFLDRFISCHPICGSENSGCVNFNPDIYKNSLFIVSKKNYHDESLILKVESFARLIGCEVKFLESDLHDKIYSLLSHLPQFLSFLTSEFSSNILRRDLGGSFRLNDSSQELWQDIFNFNAHNMQVYYEQFFDNLIDLFEKIQQNDCDYIVNYIFKAKKSLKIDKTMNFDGASLDSDSLVAFLFRLTIVSSYVRIKDIGSYKSYAGRGFADFISILNYVDSENKNKLVNLLEKSTDKLLNYFDEISK